MYIIIVALGLALGSFFNVLVLRYGQKNRPRRSYCPSCKHTLAWFDLIPILSYLFLLGKCRYCKAGISAQYIVGELAVGILFFLLLLKFGNSLYDLLGWFYIGSLLVLLSSFDIRYKIIPISLLVAICAGAIVYVFLPSLLQSLFGLLIYTKPIEQVTTPFYIPEVFSFTTPMVVEHLLTGMLTGGLILAIVLLTKERGMGMGDVPVAFLHGLLLGYPQGLLALFLSFIIGSVLGIWLIGTGAAKLKTALPFAPFLASALLIIRFFV